MATQDELLILHLSDLHFGNKCRYSELLNMAGETKGVRAN